MSDATDHDAIIRLQRDVASIKDVVDRLDKSINGNGHPGLKTRLDRIEAQKDSTLKMFSGLMVLANIILGTLALVKQWQ